MKNPFTLIKKLFAFGQKKKAAKIKAEIIKKPEEQVKEENNLFFRPKKTGTKYRRSLVLRNKTKCQIESDRRKKKKKINRIQKYSRIINRAA